MLRTKGDNIMQAVRIGLDIAKSSFQVHGVDAHGEVVIRKQLTRGQVLGYFAQLPPCLVGLEACGGAHYWARELQKLGHDVRLMAVRRPEAMVNERRRRASAAAKKAGYPPSQAHLTLLAWKLFLTNVPATVWSPKTVAGAYSLRWQVELVFRAWKSGLHVATLTATTKYSTLCYLYGRMLLILLTSALSSPLRVTVWQQHRELSLCKLARHLQAHAASWLHYLFRPPLELARFLSRLCATAARLVRKAVQNRRTSAQRLWESLGARVDFFEPALALAA